MLTLRIFLCAGLLLVLSGRPALAAFGEKGAFQSAAQSYSLEIWDKAEREFGSFVERFPRSERLAEALLFQAQAQFRQKKFPAASALLGARLGDAGAAADQFLYWIARAQFENGDFKQAAESFGKLARDFPASSKRLEAAVGEATSYAKLGEWERVSALLEKNDGAFRQSAVLGGEFYTRGLLLAGESALRQKAYARAETALTNFPGILSPVSLEWQRRYLLCRVQLESDRAEAAWVGSTNLLTLAENAGRSDLAAESVAFGTEILERLGRRAEAAALLAKNLTDNTPETRQRQALAKITALALLDNKPADACDTLQRYLDRFPSSPAADTALLMLGELQLKRYVSGEDTNLLSQAAENFRRLLHLSPKSPLNGKAELNLGWCGWLDKNIADSAAAFERATALLQSSEDLAVARFKLADCFLAQTNHVRAIENYRAALKAAESSPRARESLVSPALFQIVRANLAISNVTEAEAAMRSILELQPRKPDAERSVLLVTQGLIESGETDAAQKLFEEFIAANPGSELRPQMELLMARRKEKSGDWAGAQAAYANWQERFGTNGLVPEVEFHRAVAAARAGNETNALALFTNLLARFPTNEFAPLAQWWVADFHAGHGDTFLAELNYKVLAQTWKNTDLGLQARMMAGRMAMRRGEFLNAMEHFTNLTSNARCTGELRAEALAAYGGALMRQAGTETNRIPILMDALAVFEKIREENPDSPREALAWGESGNCFLQMATRDAAYYARATNAFQKVLDSRAAGVIARSLARQGLAQVSERMAAGTTGNEKAALLKAALDQYVEAIKENLASGEDADSYWVKRASLEGARVAEAMQEWGTAARLYELLCEKLPPVRTVLQRKIDFARAQESLAATKK